MSSQFRASAGQKASRQGQEDSAPASLSTPGDASFHRGELTYCAGELSSAFLEQPHDLGLLGRGTAAAHNSWALAGQLHELIFIVLEANLGRGWGRRAVSANATPSLQPTAGRGALPISS